MTRLARVGALLLLLGAALLACKKKPAGETEPSAASAAAPPTSPPAATAVFKPGDQVDVEWKREWWKAVVTQVSTGPRYKIHYVGWSESWDETVGPERIRPRTEGSRTQ
jgi:hypothetical protein